jgi:hypothetical protein
MSDLGIKLSRKLCVKWKCSSALRVVRTKFDICVFFTTTSKICLYVCPTNISWYYWVIGSFWSICWTKSFYWLNWSQHFHSFTIATMTWLTVTEYLCNKWPQICFIFRNHNPTLSSFMTCHQIFDKRNTMDATMEHELRSRQGYNLFFLWGSCLLIL